LRLRGLQAVISGAGGTGADTLQILDGSTVIWNMDLSAVANGQAQVSLAPLDIRASIGNNLTVAFVNGVSGDIEDVNMQGDYVPAGWPLYQA
jgi:hypothetical protein